MKNNENPMEEIVNGVGKVAYAGIRQVRRLIVLIIGAIVVLVGVAMIFLPGPAFVVIPAGIGILATEFTWARRLLHRIMDKAKSVAKSVAATSKKEKTDTHTQKDDESQKD